MASRADDCGGFLGAGAVSEAYTRSMGGPGERRKRAPSVHRFRGTRYSGEASRQVKGALGRCLPLSQEERCLSKQRCRPLRNCGAWNARNRCPVVELREGGPRPAQGVCPEWLVVKGTQPRSQMSPSPKLWRVGREKSVLKSG